MPNTGEESGVMRNDWGWDPSQAATNNDLMNPRKGIN